MVNIFNYFHEHGKQSQFLLTSITNRKHSQQCRAAYVEFYLHPTPQQTLHRQCYWKCLFTFQQNPVRVVSDLLMPSKVTGFLKCFLRQKSSRKEMHVAGVSALSCTLWLDFQKPSVFSGTVHRVLLANWAPAAPPGPPELALLWHGAVQVEVLSKASQ